MAKKKNVSVTWIWVAGLTLVVVGWLMWKRMSVSPQVAEIYEEPRREFAELAKWEFGTTLVDGKRASKEWSYTLPYKEDANKMFVKVDKKRNYCATYKMNKEGEYDPRKTYTMRLSSEIKPTGIMVEADQKIGVVGQRKWMVYILDKSRKELGMGEVKVPVVAPMYESSGMESLMMDDGNEGGGSETVSSSVVEVKGKGQEQGSNMLKMMYIKYCLDQSPTEAVEVVIDKIEWLLDAKYIGPAEMAQGYTIVE